MPKREPDDIDKVIGQNIARIRTMKGMSQEDLGAALATPMVRQAVIKYEDGRTLIPAARLVEIARVLGCRVPELIEGVEKYIPSTEPNKTAEGMFKAFNTIKSVKVQLAVANMVKAMALELSEGFKP